MPILVTIVKYFANPRNLPYFKRFFVVSILFCCGGFVYKTRVQRQHGIDALPGMTILSACLETVSGVGGGSGYLRVDDPNDAYATQASWTRESSPGSTKTSERTYGT